VLSKLEEAFAWGCTDIEACLFSDISRQTLYTYLNEHPEFLDRKEHLKENPILLARSTVVRGIKGNPDLALRFLERKKKNEFSLKQEHEIKLQEITPSDEELQGIITEATEGSEGTSPKEERGEV